MTRGSRRGTAPAGSQEGRSPAVRDPARRLMQPVEFASAALRRCGDAVEIPSLEIPFPLARQRTGRFA